MINTDRTRKLNAGNDFLMGSFTLRCIIMAPSIKTAMPAAAGVARFGNQIEAINKIANKTLSPPSTYIIVSDKPYALNSSFIELASPALHAVGFPNLKNQTLTILRKIKTLTAMFT